MRICFDIELPPGDLQRLGGLTGSHGLVDMHGRLRGSSVAGYQGRERSRFFPVLLCLETLTKINEWQMKQRKYLPLYQSGVFYKEETPGEEEWNDIQNLYEQGFGDCEDIACARTAELRHAGIPAVPCISFKDVPFQGKTVTLVHVLVLLPDDSIEDPSKVLGMKGSYTDSV